MRSLQDEPQSPTQYSSSRALKGDSIRSLRKLLQASLSSSSLTAHGHEDKQPSREQPQEDLVSPIIATEQETPQNEQQPSQAQAQAAADARRAADEVRLRLLQNLGIQKQAPPSSSTAVKTLANPPTPSSEAWDPSYTVPLNDSATAQEEEIPSRPQQVLHFDPNVTVHPIPSHKVYSNRIRETLWSGAYELQENVARNSLEFSYEDWEFENVLDEDTGLIYVQDTESGSDGKGQWIHPVHFGDVPRRAEGPPLSSDALWHYTCQRLGIQPAEYYHSLPPPGSLVKTDSVLP